MMGRGIAAQSIGSLPEIGNWELIDYVTEFRRESRRSHDSLVGCKRERVIFCARKPIGWDVLEMVTSPGVNAD